MIIKIDISIDYDQDLPILFIIIDCHWVLRSFRCRYDKNSQIYQSGLTASAVDRKVDHSKIRLGALLFVT